MSDPVAGRDGTKRPAIGLVAIPLLVLAVYWPCLNGGFLWDDNAYVSENDAVQAPDGLRRIWSSLYTHELPQYYPLTFTTFWAEWQLWQDATLGYHLLNVLLHAANALLFWIVLRQMNLPGAWFAAAVFAVHPINVESVAWITERKNVLSGLFFLLSFSAYWRFVVRGTVRWYPLAIFAFCCALLSKTTAVMLPAVLLLALWWAGRLFERRVWLSLIPMFVVSMLFSALTIYYEEHRVGAVGVEWSAGSAERFAVAGRIVWFYLYKILLPHGFSFTYPRWNTDPQAIRSYAAVAALVAAGLVLAFRRTPWRRPVLAGLAAFLACLFPVLGFFNIFFMRYSFVADHFAYLPAMCLIALFICGAAHWIQRRQVRPALPNVAGVALIALLGGMAWDHSRLFRDPETLYRDILDRNPDSWMALNNLGTLMLKREDPQQAADLFRRARLANSIVQEPYDNERAALLRLGRYADAVEVARLGKKNAKDNVRITLELARLLATAPDPAVRDGQEAVIWARVVAENTLDGKSFEALDVLACAYAENGEFGKAVRTAQRAIEAAHDADRSDWAESYRDRLRLFVNRKPYHAPDLSVRDDRPSSHLDAGREPPSATRDRTSPTVKDRTTNGRPSGTETGPTFSPPLPRDRDQWEAPLRAALDTALERIRTRPDDARRVGLLGMLYHANRLHDLAAPCYRRATLLAPDEPKWLYLTAVTATLTGDAETARAALFQLQERRPDYPPALFRLAEILLDEGNLDDAAMLFERMTEVAPAQAGGFYGAGRVEFLRGQFARARDLLQQAGQRVPNSREILYQLGMARLQLSRRSADPALRDLARQTLESARNANSLLLYDDPWIAELGRLQISSALLVKQAAEAEALGRLDSSAELLERALRRRPRNAQFLIQLARVRYKQGDLQSSRTLCRRATSVAPRNHRNWLELAELCRNMDEMKEAWNAVFRALEIAPHDVRVMYLAARILLEAEQLEDAAAGFQRVLDHDPNHAAAAARLADVLLRLHRDDRALSPARRAVQLEPDVSYHRYVLGLALARTGDLDAAERELRRALELSPDSNATRQQLDWVLEQKNKTP